MAIIFVIGLAEYCEIINIVGADLFAVYKI
jgi:hypothetical protein